MRIKFSDVSHIYQSMSADNTAAVKNVTLDLSDFSITAIVGHTGSGKSTAMQHINGLLQATSGQVVVEDTVITNKKNRQLATIRQHIGYVFQNPAYQLFASTILEDVMYGPLNFGYNKADAQKAAKQALTAVGVAENLYEAYPFDLSGGQMRKVALAGALAYNPEVLILDEPTVGLDPLATQELMELFKQLHEKEKKSLIFITHDMEFVYELAKRVIVFAEGEVVFDGTPYQLFTNIELLELYALDMPDIFKLAHGLAKKGVDLEMNEQAFSLDKIIEILKKKKGMK